MAVSTEFEHIRRTARTLRVATTAAIVLLADQLSKVWAVEVLSDRTVDLVWTLRLHLTRNTGFAFSAGAGLGPLLALLVPVIVVVLWRYRLRVHGRIAPLALGLLLGGALGNLVDRLVRGRAWGRGGVVDFVDLGFWPVFNVADAAIVVGVAVLTLHLYRNGGTPRDA
ncbi:MAG TPA: signal peptidase II [Acidimicrobiaceae bacterium]|nr:signal peptidase II [Acidimicrobiaceae bacterium]